MEEKICKLAVSMLIETVKNKERAARLKTGLLRLARAIFAAYPNEPGGQVGKVATKLRKGRNVV